MRYATEMIVHFMRAKAKLVKIINEKKLKGFVTEPYFATLQRCEKIISDLYNVSIKYTPKMVEQEMQGLKNSLQVKIAENLANNQTGELLRAVMRTQSIVEYVLGRIADDSFRANTLEQLALMNSGGFSVNIATKLLRESLEQENIPCFIDKSGRVWDLNVYSNMAIRTGSRQARNAGMLSRDEHDLYYIVPLGSTCPICARLEGRVYSKSGTNPNYPPLTEAYGKILPDGPNDLSNSWLTIHPNCRHTLVKYTEMTHTKKEIKEMQNKSSFEKNPTNLNAQTKKEIERYQEEQRRNAVYRAIGNEYNEMQAYGIKVPQNFQNFINAKTENSQKYIMWKKQLSIEKAKQKLMKE